MYSNLQKYDLICEFCFIFMFLVQKLQDVETEAPAVIKTNRPSDDWPKQGEIKFEKYKMKYRDNLPLALKGVGFTVRAKEKIGIVGRSGSGNSKEKNVSSEKI